MPNDAWLDRRYYGGDLPAAAERALHAVGQDWHDEAAAERHIRAALALAPDHLTVQIAAYKFLLYRHRLAEALPYAEACLAETLRADVCRPTGGRCVPTRLLSPRWSRNRACSCFPWWPTGTCWPGLDETPRAGRR